MADWLQKVFDTAVAGLAAQGFERAGRMEDGEFRCNYRAPDGKRCAIGQLIDKDMYSRFGAGLEGTSVVSLPSKLLTELTGLPEERLRPWGEDCRMLEGLQRAHDEGETPEQMRRNLVTFASVYGLKLPAALIEEG